MFRALEDNTIHIAIEVLPMPSRNCLNDRNIISGRILHVSMSKYGTASATTSPMSCVPFCGVRRSLSDHISGLVSSAAAVAAMPTTVQ